MHRRLLSTLVLAAVASLSAVTAQAAVPQIINVQGLLTAAAGTPAPDGVYDVVFRLYDAEFNGKELWLEGSQPVGVKGAMFALTLGLKKPLDAKLFTNATDIWLGMQIQGDPELPRRRLASVPLALRAALAEGLDCSGCVQQAHLDPALLAPYAKAADLAKVATSGQYGDLQGVPDLIVYAKKSALADVALTGKFADLNGVPAMAKLGAACGTGLVMRGLKADGSYDCVAGGIGAGNLPSDGLDEVSGGLLFNQFKEMAASTTAPQGIPDNSPVGITNTIDIADLGLAQAITITVDIANSDISSIQLVLTDPNGGKFTLYDKSATGKTLTMSWSAPDKLASGDLGTWLGKNAKGTWSLQVIDTAFFNNKIDGALQSWSITIQVQSSKKVGVGGALVLYNAKAPPYPCEASVSGSIYFDTATKAVRYCDGSAWRNLADTCGNGILDLVEECDDGNNISGDGCSSTCISALGFTKTKPGASCLNILDAAKISGDPVKNGDHWIKAPKGQVVQVWCDMTTEGGGYTYFPIATGKQTFKSTDDNSCKDYGLDIFFPRSKAQWTVVLAKYDASWFAAIPGVIRNTGSGSYTGCIMRNPVSYGSGCGDWQVGDGGRWWLRDATYTEPNGDYEANCWLSMYKFDANDIQFNDGNCSTPTSKYLCSTNDKK